MIEAEWLTCEEPETVLRYLSENVSDRKVRLFLVACARRNQAPQTEMTSNRIERLWSDAISAGECYADGLESLVRCEILRNELIQEGTACPLIEAPLFADIGRGVLAWSCLVDETILAASACCELAGWNTRDPSWGTPGFVAAVTAEKRGQVALLRDIFGNPFRPVAFLPEWRTGTATALASLMYEARDFSALPILADALQDAGCDSTAVLDHCRGAGPHVRGCWVVDLVSGKEGAGNPPAPHNDAG